MDDNPVIIKNIGGYKRFNMRLMVILAVLLILIVIPHCASLNLKSFLPTEHTGQERELEAQGLVNTKKFADHEMLTCYSCKSSEFQVDPSCEETSFDTKTEIDCPKCYSIFNKNPTTSKYPLIIRACMSTKDFQNTIYADESKFRAIHCSEMNCNTDSFDFMAVLEKNTDNEGQNRTCYECSSEGDNSCAVVNEAFTIVGKSDCRDKPCAIIHNTTEDSIVRKCIFYNEIRVIITQGYPNITVEWCAEDKCNIRQQDTFPGCEKSKINSLNEWEGCVELGNSTKPPERIPQKETGKSDIKRLPEQKLVETNYSNRNLIIGTSLAISLVIIVAKMLI